MNDTAQAMKLADDYQAEAKKLQAKESQLLEEIHGVERQLAELRTRLKATRMARETVMSSQLRVLRNTLREVVK